MKANEVETDPILADMKMLWCYLAAIQMQDINTNEGVTRFREARHYYNAAYSKIEARAACPEVADAAEVERLKEAMHEALAKLHFVKMGSLIYSVSGIETIIREALAGKETNGK